MRIWTNFVDLVEGTKRLSDADLERLTEQWLAAEQQRNEQLLAEMLRQRTCILAYQRGAKTWRS